MICSQVFKFTSFSAKYPQWIPYAIMGSTGISLPLVALVKGEYNRSAVDSEEFDENSIEEDLSRGD